MNSKVKKLAREIIQAEAQALNDLADNLSEDFDAAVNLILETEKTGRIILCGIGKAGIIANKISATLASIGTPSHFLHAAEASHGDLGRFHRNDLVIILSNSGETEEICRLVSFIKTIGCPTLAITANRTNTLAKYSDLILELGETKEAGHLGLAPTTSTTKMLALGDALALSVMDQKNLSAEDFAFNHPGGSLGRKLITVKELMRKGDRVCIMPDTALLIDVIKQYSATEGRPGAAILVDSAGKLSGVFTDGDLRRCLEQSTSLEKLLVKDFMGTNPKSISPDALATEALRILADHHIDQIIVIDQEKPVGLLDIQDLYAVK